MNVLELKLGDRVTLYSPVLEYRAFAVYDGSFASLNDAQRKNPAAANVLVEPVSAEWLNSGYPWARFILKKPCSHLEFVAPLRIERDGNLSDPEGRPVLIEERMSFVGRG